MLTQYLRHYDTARPYRSLDLQPPNPARHLALIEPTGARPPTHPSTVERIDVLSGLIHQYRRAA